MFKRIFHWIQGESSLQDRYVRVIQAAYMTPIRQMYANYVTSTL